VSHPALLPSDVCVDLKATEAPLCGEIEMGQFRTETRRSVIPPPCGHARCAKLNNLSDEARSEASFWLEGNYQSLDEAAQRDGLAVAQLLPVLGTYFSTSTT
jgi:hypothetical protein